MRHVEKYVLVPYEEYNKHTAMKPALESGHNTENITVPTPQEITGVIQAKHDVLNMTPDEDDLNTESFNVENFITYMNSCNSDGTNTEVLGGGSAPTCYIPDQPTSLPLLQQEKKQKKGWISL